MANIKKTKLYKLLLKISASKLKISKKTIYKYFPDKETLSIALYETYYSNATNQVKELISKNTKKSYKELHYIYYDSKK